MTMNANMNENVNILRSSMVLFCVLGVLPVNSDVDQRIPAC